MPRVFFQILINFRTHHNVAPVDSDVGVPVGSVHLVHEAEGVEELVDYDLDDGDENNDNFKGLNLLVDAATSLKPNLHSASPSPVGDLSVAAAAARDDVHIVMLICTRNKPLKRVQI